jgi:hypothetical protein
VTPKRRYGRPVLALAVIAAGAGALASPPGRALINSVREAVGVENSQPALFSLPAPGRVLVTSVKGPWVVDPDGSRRLLGSYREASWSPFGRYVVATRRNELAALEPDGDVHWSLGRPGVHGARWGGGRTDTRIAYLDRTGLRVVAGDGTGDRLLVPDATGPLAWRPGNDFELAYVSGEEVLVRDAESGRVHRRASRGTSQPASAIAWSGDGKLLLVLSPHSLRVFDPNGRVVAQDDPSDATEDVAATFLPGTHRVAVVRLHGTQTDVFDLRTGKTLFHIEGTLRQAVASPNGRWLLLTFPTADQWVFVRLHGAHTIRGVSGIARQFGGKGFPLVVGWLAD